MLRVVLDTNVILKTVSRRSVFKFILDKLFAGEFELYVTTEILLEYEEKISQIFDKEVAEIILGALTLSAYVKKQEVNFKFLLIANDDDDNKFVDCAFAANAHYLVTNDKDFNVLKEVDFPKINVVKIEEFINLIE